MMSAAAMTSGLMLSSENPAIEFAYTVFMTAAQAADCQLAVVENVGTFRMVVPETLVMIAMAITATPAVIMPPITSMC